MHALNYFLLILSGLSAGFLTAAAFVAFVAMLGIFPKVAAKTKTASQCILYENCLMLGILFSTYLQFFVSYESAGFHGIPHPPFAIGLFILILIGLFGGIYIGFLIGGLSEVLNVIPIFARKAHLQSKVALIIFFLALGKGIFTCIQFLILDV